MADDTPLKLVIEPGEYHCTWSLLDQGGEPQEFPGDLELRPGLQPIGSAHGNLPITWSESNGGFSAGFPQTRTYPSVRGHLISGHDVLMLEATVQFWSRDRAFIDARAAIVGLQLFDAEEPPDLFTGCKLQVTGLDSIAGVAPLKSFTFPANNDVHLQGEWSAEGNPDSSQEWSASGTTLRLEYDASARVGDPYSYGLAFSPVLVIETEPPLIFDSWVSNWVDPLSRLVALVTGRREEITYFSVKLAAREPWPFHRYAQVFAHGLSQKPYASQQRELLRIKPAMRLKADSLSLLELTSAWQRLNEEHHPLVETYGAFLGAPRQHPRARFLLLIQSLEALYGYETRAIYEARRAKHTVLRDEVIEAALPHLQPQQRRFLKNSVSKSPMSSLDEAMKATFTTLPIDLSAELGEQPLIHKLKDDPRPHEGPVETLRLIRNDLAHGSQGYDVLGLHDVSQVLERVTRAHMLRVLGCPLEVQERALAR